MQGGKLHDLQYCSDCNILVVFPTLGLNIAKIIDYIEKCFKQNVVQKQISCKKLCGSRSLFTLGVELGGVKHLPRTRIKK